MQPSTSSVFGRTLALAAGIRGGINTVRLLLNTPGIDVNVKSDYYGKTALMMASEGGYVDVVRLLLATPRIDVNAKDDFFKTTALMMATAHGHVDVVRLLLGARGIDVNATDPFGMTVLHQLAYSTSTRTDMVRLFLNVPGIDVNAKDTNGRTALILAATNATHAPIIRLLLDAPGIDVNAKDSQGTTALMTAVAGGHEDIARLVLAAPGIDVNAKDDIGYTALMLAAMLKHERIVHMLLTAPGIDVQLNTHLNENIPLPASMRRAVQRHVVQRTRAMSAKNVTNELKKWTTGVYKGVQNTRRGVNPTNAFIRPSVYQTNAALTRYMSNHAMTAPNIPPRWMRTTQLYRGIHGVQAQTLRERGYVHSPGFVAVSRSKNVATTFSRRNKTNGDNYIMQLDITRSIPRGTPWIWFHNDDSNTENENHPWSDALEDEVLLPPGWLFVVPAGVTHERMYDLVRVFQSLSRARVPSRVQRVAPNTWRYGGVDAVVTRTSTALHVTFKSLGKASLTRQAFAALAIVSKVVESFPDVRTVCVRNCGKDVAVVLGYAWNRSRPDLAFADLEQLDTINNTANNTVNAIYVPDVRATSTVNTRTPIINTQHRKVIRQTIGKRKRI